MPILSYELFTTHMTLLHRTFNKKKTMKIIKVNQENLPVYMNLGQHYSAEFSPLTKQLPEKDGTFYLENPISETTTGYLLYIDGLPAGLTLIASTEQNHYEFLEFYVTPIFRKNKAGMKFAHALFEMLPGEWVSKQIEGADYAVTFWRNTIGSYTNENYSEDMYQDSTWGLVTRQRFSAV